MRENRGGTHTGNREGKKQKGKDGEYTREQNEGKQRENRYRKQRRKQTKGKR